MPDQTAVKRHQLMLKLDQLALDLATLNNSDPERLRQGWRDILTLDDRLEPWDMTTMFIDGVELPVPDVGWIDGGDSGLFYRGYLNMVWGDDGHGKSLLIDQVTWIERGRGHRIMILESEELSPMTRVARWLDESEDRQRITAEDVAGVIVYPVHRPLSQANVQMMATQIRNEDVSVVFIDSLGTLMANMGYDENNAKDVYIVKQLVFDPLTEAGAAVVVIDHVTKADGEKPKSIGSTRKRSMLSGVGFELRADDQTRWSRKKSGHADLRCWKDRQGGFNSGEHVATLWVTPSEVNGYLTLAIEAPEDLTTEEPPAVQPIYAGGVRNQEQLIDEFEAIITEQSRIGRRGLVTLLGLNSQTEVRVLEDIAKEQGRFYRDRGSNWHVTQQKVAE